MLLPGYNAPLLRLHQVLAGEATARVLRLAVVYLGLGANSRHLSARLRLRIVTRGVVRRRRGAVFVHTILSH